MLHVRGTHHVKDARAPDKLSDADVDSIRCEGVRRSQRMLQGHTTTLIELYVHGRRRRRRALGAGSNSSYDLYET